MINLLPEKAKQEIRSSRVNTAIARYVIVLILAAAFLTVLCFMTHLLIVNKQKLDNQVMEQNKSSVNSSYLLTDQAKNIQSSLTTAQKIMNSQVSYSKILTELGNVLPNGVVIESLQVTNAKLGSPIALKLLASSRDLTNQIKDSFKRSTLFTGYTMQSVEAENSQNIKYPVAINATVIINRGAAK